MRQEDFPEKMAFGIIIDVGTNACGVERCSHNSQIFNSKDYKRDIVITQDHKNNGKTIIKSNNIIIKISVLN